MWSNAAYALGGCIGDKNTTRSAAKQVFRDTAETTAHNPAPLRRLCLFGVDSKVVATTLHKRGPFESDIGQAENNDLLARRKT